MQSNPPVINTTGGQVGELMQARVDVPSYTNGSELMENFWPYAQGPMTRRPALEYIDTFVDSAKRGFQIPFVFSADQSYNILATSDGFEFFIQDGKVTIPAVTASITNGKFIDASAWNNVSTGTATMTIINGKCYLDSRGADRAAVEQGITISDVGVLHVVTFEVLNGPVDLSIGSGSGLTDYVHYASLPTGYHAIEFTPTANAAYINFSHSDNAGRIVDNVAIMRATTRYIVPHPYTEADLANLHWQQIGDELYLTVKGYHPRRLQRRGHRSWSMTLFLPSNGPMGDPNTSDTTLTPSDTEGEITITASVDTFDTDDQYTLFQMTHSGQDVFKVGTAVGHYTKGVKITGIGNAARTFAYYITGTFVGTVALQRSSGNENSYADYTTFTVPTSNSFNDALDNQTWYYRLYVKAYTSGTINLEIIAQGGSQTGIARCTEYLTPTTIKAEVLTQFGAFQATNVWKRGAWNAKDGFPVSVAQGYARLWMARGIKIWGSVSDDFGSFDESNTDADKALSRTEATSQDGIRFLAFGTHLLIGTQTGESIGSPNTNAQPVGPTNFETKKQGQDGVSTLRPVVVGASAIYPHRSRRRLMQLVQDPKALSDTQYASVDLNRLSPELLWDGIKQIAIQREPERRIYVVLASGIVRVLLFRREEDVVAWSTIKTQGIIENVNIIAQNDQDAVYFVVRRKVGGVWKRFVERFANEIYLNDEDYYHLDSSLALPLARPDTKVTPSGTTGTITLETDDPCWLVTDVGSVVWVNGGQVSITGYVDTTHVTGTVNFNLLATDKTDGTDPAPSGRWGIGQPAMTLYGLEHLEGMRVRVYGDQSDMGYFTVSAGAVALPRPITVAYVGLDFSATGQDGRWKSQRLSYGAQRGSALTMNKAIKGLSFMLYRSGDGLSFGGSFKPAEQHPVNTRLAKGQAGAPIALFSGERIEAHDARYATDPRLYFTVSGPAPCTITGYVPTVDTHER